MTAAERKLALRISAIYAIPVTLIMVIPLIIGAFLYRDFTNDRITDNTRLIMRVEQERIERSRAINAFVYDQCIQSEVRDVIIVEQLRAARARARQSLPAGPLRTEQIEILTDGIVALEPPNEPDCEPPPATTP
jgi:hypothetical protein